MTAEHNKFCVPSCSKPWNSEGWTLLTSARGWERYKRDLDEQYHRGRPLNHGRFAPERYPCLVWSVNTFAGIPQHLFLYAEDAQPLIDLLVPRPGDTTPRARLSLLAERSAR